MHRPGDGWVQSRVGQEAAPEKSTTFPPPVVPPAQLSKARDRLWLELRAKLPLGGRRKWGERSLPRLSPGPRGVDRTGSREGDLGLGPVSTSIELCGLGRTVPSLGLSFLILMSTKVRPYPSSEVCDSNPVPRSLQSRKWGGPGD